MIGFTTKNKGFTLVELLAVIVILAIIMIIAIPSVLSVLKTSKISSFDLFGKKAIMETEKKELSHDITSDRINTGIHVYDIKKDLGLSNTGNYEGFVVVDHCSDDIIEYYLYLKDDTYMVYDYNNSSNVDITKFKSFKNLNDSEWSEKASDKEHASASVIELTGGYECSVYSSGEVVDTSGVAGGTNKSYSAVFLDGASVDYAMLTLAGNTDFVKKTGSNGGYTVTNKNLNSSSKLEDVTDKNIKVISRTSSMNDEQKASAQIVSTEDSQNPIYMWFDDGTIYWYTDATMVYANRDAFLMFGWLGGISTVDVSEINFNQTINLASLFLYDYNLTSLDLSSMNVRNVKYMMSLFYNCISLKSLDISSWNTSNVIDISSMFSYVKSATSIKFPKNLVNSNVKSMTSLFAGCSSVETLDVSGFVTNNVENMNYVFFGCTNLTRLNVSNWKTSKVKTMEGLFGLTRSITELDVSNWDTSNVENMYALFYVMSNLKRLDLSKWNTSKVKDMSAMIRECTALTTLDLSNFDVSNVENMGYMFWGSNNITTLDLSNWILKQGADAQSIFNYMSELETIYVSESWKDKIILSKNDGVFYGDKKLVGGNGTKFISSYDHGKNRAVIDGENGAKGYFTKKA